MSRRRANRRRRRPWRKLLGITLFAVVVLSSGAVLALRWLDPPTTAFMLRDMVGGQSLDHSWVAWENLSPQLAIAAVASEDQRFPDHAGFDLDAIADALHDQVDGGRLRGASTITQQVAKNLFLWPGRSYLRKGLEAYFTILIEALWPKRRILEVYLNVAQFGPGIYGVAAASRVYFGRRPDRISAYQAALMMTVLPNPMTIRLASPTDYMYQRASWIRRQVRQLGGVAYLASMD